MQDIINQGIQLLAENHFAFLFLVALLGLIFGSFFNVVIYRLPIMIYRTWTIDSHEFLDLSLPPKVSEQLTTKINLLFPASHCPECKTTIKFYDNVPVFSYLFLGGKCRTCKTDISSRYLKVELLTAILFTIVALRFGPDLKCFFGLMLTGTLIVQSFIDFDEQIIPDELTLPVLWLGLLIALNPVFVSLEMAVIGAVVGYLSFFCIYWIFYFVTGKDGMGQGDFKLLAMLGAWLGWEMVPLIVILSAILGAVVGVALIIFAKHNRNNPIPFGPYIAIAGFVAMLYGPQINNWYLVSTGLTY